jgi:pimeloyl-[acyl-carrier protein] methyl ester esterase
MNWLLLRGLAREQRHWHEFRSLLTERVGAGRVHLLDVAGTGTEHARVPRPSVGWLARDVARRWPALAADAGGQGDAWCVLGLSLGGMIALELCRQCPRRLTHAVIVNASSRLTPRRERLRPAAAVALAGAAFSADALRREQRILAFTSALPHAERVRYALLAAEFGRASSPSVWAVLAQLAAAARFSPPARSHVAARLRFVCSRNDTLVNPQSSRDLAGWYGAACDEHPWAGHDLPLDDPGWLCERLADIVLAGGRGAAEARA